jgi:hypothetical protein
MLHQSSTQRCVLCKASAIFSCLPSFLRARPRRVDPAAPCVVQVEDYFRDVQDTDVKVLEPRPERAQDPQLAIPVLGRPYRQVWQEEDASNHRSTTTAQQRQSATVAKQKLLSASPVSKAKKRNTAEASTAPLITSVVRHRAPQSMCRAIAPDNAQSSSARRR